MTLNPTTFGSKGIYEAAGTAITGRVMLKVIYLQWMIFLTAVHSIDGANC
jgi:hypothetical protein